jgi:sugar fermentation stimulation protein A
MRFPDPLVPGTLRRRYKRFLADVELPSGAELMAHCANPGSMLGLAEPGMAVWLSPSRNPERKLKYSWEIVAAKDGLVGINTSHPNTLVAEALAADRIPELAGYDRVRREVRYGRNSRIDLLLEGDGRPACYLEVKNVTLKRGAAAAEFPDSVTARGTKHLEELAKVARSGARAVMLYLVQRGDCSHVEIAADIDPVYAEAFARARDRGVEAFAYDCRVDPAFIELDRALAIAA